MGEAAIIISVLSLVASVYFNIRTLRKSEKEEQQTESASMTTVIVKLENIGTGVSEIKSDLRNVKNDLKEDREKIVRIDESCKQAHKRLDALEKKMG